MFNEASEKILELVEERSSRVEKLEEIRDYLAVNVGILFVYDDVDGYCEARDLTITSEVKKEIALDILSSDGTWDSLGEAIEEYMVRKGIQKG